MVKEAESQLSSHLYDEALKKCEEALTFAKKKQTIQFIENNISKTRTLKINENKAEELNTEAENLLSEQKYEEALKLLEEALISVKKKETLLVITRNMKQVKDITRSQVKSEEIVKEAKSFLSGHLYDAALKKFEAALSFAKKKQTVQDIESNINKIRTLKVNEYKAEKMKKEADTLMQTHQYKQALNKLYHALNYTQKDTALIKESIKRANIMKKKERKVQDLKNQAQTVQTLLNDNCYDQALQKFDEALKRNKNPDTINPIKSDKTRTQQLEHSKTVKFANDETLITTKKINKARTFNQRGETLLAEAWNAEDLSADRSLEATKKFGQAKNLFIQANDTYPSTKHEENLKLVDAKIQGNRYYYAGVKLEREAALLIEKIESLVASKEVVSKYNLVQEKYANAMKKFREGMKINEEKFKFSVGVVHEARGGVQEMLNELKKCILGDTIEDIKIKVIKIIGEKINKQCDPLN